jgi:hypothetical protein
MTCHIQFIFITSVPSGFNNAHHNNKSFSQSICQVQSVTSFMLIAVIVQVIPLALGVNINHHVELA